MAKSLYSPLAFAAAIAIIGSAIYAWKNASRDLLPPQDALNMAVVAYSSNSPQETLLWESTNSHHNRKEESSVTNAKLVAVGEGLPLFNTPAANETMRGWMFRFRAMVDGIIEEYEARNREDFIVVIGDAFDTYITETSTGNTLALVKEKFLTDFSNYSIVFSSQIYCCNPWNLREVGRAGWDEYYEQIGGPATLYKHLNAGMLMGKASAIIDMANEMNVWETEYKRPDEFDAILQAQGESKLHMFDADVDDDEWQLSVWFIKDQQKKKPTSALDMHQELFTTTGTFRASYRDGGFLIFSQDDFYGVVGTLPAVFDKMELDQVKQCPYTFDWESKTWTNTLTQSHPLIFHFAGFDWLCACEILQMDQRVDVTNKKFASNCLDDFPHWQVPVNQGVFEVSNGKNPKQQLFLRRDVEQQSVTERELAVSGYGPSCIILSFNLWNADRDVVTVPNFASGSTICSSAYRISIEAVADNCVSTVQFRLLGSDGSSYTNTEMTRKYTLFQNMGDDVYGGFLPPANYTLTATPNGDGRKTRTLTFTVVPC
jgi:hypothetical protein